MAELVWAVLESADLRLVIARMVVRGLVVASDLMANWRMVVWLDWSVAIGLLGIELIEVVAVFVRLGCRIVLSRR